MRHFLLGLAVLCAAPLLGRAAPEGASPVPVVLKLDDLRTNDSGYLSARWRKLGDLIRERKIKASIGIIANSLEGEKPAYFAWLKELQATGLVEFWFHGYDHADHPVGDTTAGEFSARTYEEQKERFAKSQQLAIEKLGFAFATYGPPGGGKLGATEEDLDATVRVLSEDTAIKVWLYPTPINPRGQKLADAGKITVLDRVFPVNIEQPLFVPNSEKFIQGYVKYSPTRRYFVVQGHPNKWDDARWPEFVKIIDYLQQNQIPTVLPAELAASLSAHATP